MFIKHDFYPCQFYVDVVSYKRQRKFDNDNIKQSLKQEVIIMIRIKHLLTNAGREAKDQLVVVDYDSNYANMFSYGKFVAQVVKGRVPLHFVSPAWDYSRTTCRYVVQFFKEYGGLNVSREVKRKNDIDKLIKAGEIELKDM